MAAEMRPQTKKVTSGLVMPFRLSGRARLLFLPAPALAGGDAGSAHHKSMPYAEPVRACLLAWACTAVMATVLTISGTVQPRERSFTGLFKP